MKQSGGLLDHETISIRWVAAILLLESCSMGATAQTEYQPKFKGDPAKIPESEAAALGYTAYPSFGHRRLTTRKEQ